MKPDMYVYAPVDFTYSLLTGYASGLLATLLKRIREGPPHENGGAPYLVLEQLSYGQSLSSFQRKARQNLCRAHA
jgi:hypothetical protein